MDEFILNIDSKKFQSTNSPWNDLMLNDPWSVGYVTTIIEYKIFTNKEEWGELYYKTGEYRNKIIKENYEHYQEILNDESLVRTNKNKIHQLPKDISIINTAHGRTKEDLYEKAKILFDYLHSVGNDNLSLDECFECIRFRTICETWNGVILRERNTVKTLKAIYPLYTFNKVPAEMDHMYAVDYQVFKDGHLILALQIKPKSYLGTAPYIVKARNANKKKNELYYQKFGVRVMDVISKTNGEILNMEEVNKVFDLLQGRIC